VLYVWCNIIGGKKQMEKKETIVEAEEEKNILEGDIQIRDCSELAFEIDIPGSVIARLNVNPDKGRVRFVEENGRVYLERDNGASLEKA
jgi:hypothetical protein